mmetsp:Transcript_52312/g.124843  ORF Transcript_52312/g.124843 Transcript_52312/m.124843 type:complete len:215 (-) Transcript_52312:66-710(-)
MRHDEIYLRVATPKSCILAVTIDVLQERHRRHLGDALRNKEENHWASLWQAIGHTSQEDAKEDEGHRCQEDYNGELCSNHDAKEDSLNVCDIHAPAIAQGLLTAFCVQRGATDVPLSTANSKDDCKVVCHRVQVEQHAPQKQQEPNRSELMVKLIYSNQTSIRVNRDLLGDSGKPPPLISRELAVKFQESQELAVTWRLQPILVLDQVRDHAVP